MCQPINTLTAQQNTQFLPPGSNLDNFFSPTSSKTINKDVYKQQKSPGVNIVQPEGNIQIEAKQPKLIKHKLNLKPCDDPDDNNDDINQTKMQKSPKKLKNYIKAPIFF